MTIIEDIRARLESRFPHVEVEHDATSLTCYPFTPDGFLVRLVVQNPGPWERYLLYYDQSLQQPTNRPGIIRDFAFALSTSCRLRVFSRHGRPYRWITDLQDFSGWKPYWETYDFSGPFWKFWYPAKVRVLQNPLINVDDGDCGPCGCTVTN